MMFVILTVTLLVLELCDALLARLLVLLSMGPLAVHAAVPDEAAGRAVLQFDGVVGFPTAVAQASTEVFPLISCADRTNNNRVNDAFVFCFATPFSRVHEDQQPGSSVRGRSKRFRPEGHLCVSPFRNFSAGCLDHETGYDLF